jgi:hypothetical protein
VAPSIQPIDGRKGQCWTGIPLRSSRVNFVIATDRLSTQGVEPGVPSLQSLFERQRLAFRSSPTMPAAIFTKVAADVCAGPAK